MDLIFTHFWLFCGLFAGVGNGLFFRHGLASNIENSDIKLEEINKFTKQYILWIFVPCFILWLMQLTLGTEFNYDFLSWPLLQKSIALFICVFCWTALLYWVFVKDGANTYSNYLILSKSSLGIFSSPIMIKIGSILVVFSGVYAIWAF